MSRQTPRQNYSLAVVPAVGGFLLSMAGLAILGDFPRGAFEAAGLHTGVLVLCAGWGIQLLVKFR